jgi:hypothetical protein
MVNRKLSGTRMLSEFRKLPGSYPKASGDSRVCARLAEKLRLSISVRGLPDIVPSESAFSNMALRVIVAGQV